MDLGTALAIAQLVVATALTGGLALGLDQMRQLRRHRRDLAAVELMHTLQDADFTRAFRTIYTLPVGVSAEELRNRGSACEDAAQIVGVRYETLGLLAHRGVIPFDLLSELTGGATVALWSRLEKWVDAVREEQAQSMYLEWFQWLAQQFVRLGRSTQEPAYLRYRTWRPWLVDRL